MADRIMVPRAHDQPRHYSTVSLQSSKHHIVLYPTLWVACWELIWPDQCLAVRPAQLAPTTKRVGHNLRRRMDLLVSLPLLHFSTRVHTVHRCSLSQQDEPRLISVTSHCAVLPLHAKSAEVSRVLLVFVLGVPDIRLGLAWVGQLVSDGRDPPPFAFIHWLDGVMSGAVQSSVQ